jgi:hypothetical protein
MHAEAKDKVPYFNVTFREEGEDTVIIIGKTFI